MKPGIMFILPWSLNKIGGVNTVIKELCREFTEEGHWAPVVITADWEANSPREIKHKNFIEIKMRLRPYPNSLNKDWLAYWLTYIPFLLSLKRIITKYNIKTINYHFPNEYCLPFQVPRRFRWVNKLVLSFHGADVTAIQSVINTRRWQSLFNTTDDVTTCSNGLKKELSRLVQSTECKTTTLYNGVFRPSEIIFEELPKKLPDHYVLCIGTYELKKGQDTLIKAFKSLSKIYPEQHLVLAGRKTPYFESLVNLTKSLELTQRVHFYFDIQPEQIWQFYDNATLYVSASRSEPFGIVMLEAGLSATPVIATKSFGALEIIEPYRDGLLVEIDNEMQMADSIATLLEDSELRKEYGTNLEHKVRNTFTWKSTQQKLAELIR